MDSITAFSLPFFPGTDLTLLNNSTKCILPVKYLHLDTNLSDTPNVYKITNLTDNMHTYVTVHEFCECDSSIYLPRYIMDHHFILEGDVVGIEKVDLPIVETIELTPLQEAFYDSNVDAKSEIEKIIIDFYQVLAKGHIIKVRDWYLEVTSMSPGNACLN